MTVFEAQLQQHIERGPFSESFLVNPADGGEPFEILGIFDASVVLDDGKKSARPVPRIIVFKVPVYESGKTEIEARGKTYRIQKHETDANLGTVVFLI